MVTLTKRAAEEVLNVMASQDLDANGHFLRVGVRGGGCSGYQYTLDVVSEKNDEQDEQWDFDGVKVLCDSRCLLYLEGTTIDFKDELMGRGFTFDNPNKTSCGCGSSFS